MVAMRLGLDGHEEAPLRRHHLQRVAGLQGAVDPVGEDAALHLAHAHAQLAVVDAGADRIGAPQVLALDVLAQREVLALREAEDTSQFFRHLEGDDHGLGGVGLDPAHAQGMEIEVSWTQMGLKCSKGSRHATQR